jgi:glyoxylase-like metal-dependent hydrolase (beta-lactamase superfamily II)/rhodanese-related sulfurtransferase
VAHDEATSTISAAELLALLDDDALLYLLDVREPDEVADWQIPHVHNIPLGQLEARIHEVPRDHDVVVICAKGERALQGAKILSGHAVSSRVLDGGMGAWASTFDHVSGDFGGATVVQLRRRGKGCLSYVIGAGTNCVVIDPALDVNLYVEIAREHHWTITHVLDTHLHADHLSGARALSKVTQAELWLNAGDDFNFDYEPLSDGRNVALAPGVELTVSAVSVPGHTEGSTMYRLGNAAIFTGDTVFLESVGRPDLADQAEPFAHHLFQSLHERVLPLDDAIMVFPAHYGASVEVHAGQFVARPLGELRNKLPALALEEDEFVAWAISNVKDRPGNYQHIVLINSGREELTGNARELESGPNRCAVA